MIPLLFFFWFISPVNHEGAVSGPYLSYVACTEATLLFEAEGETTSLCYAKSHR